MKIKRHHFESIGEFNKFMGLPKPEHPLLYVATIYPSAEESLQKCSDEIISLSNDFYLISFKKVTKGVIHYGRTKYDCEEGVMFFTSPNQEIILEGVVVSEKSTIIIVHDDYLKGYETRNNFKKYGFFTYSANEALHLSPREESQMELLMENIEQEYHNNQDEFSKDLILSQLDTLLKYANRYYKRQFLNRMEISGDIAEQFKNILSEYFESGQFLNNGIPSIDDMAKRMNMSPRYLSDVLKTETGKSALQHIHSYLIEEGKNLLLESDLTIEKVSYKLGFEYPHYFSRLFKKKVGKSPSAFRDEFIKH